MSAMVRTTVMCGPDSNMQLIPWTAKLKGADEGADAAEYVKRMRQQNKLIMGIGHRIKSLSNPDMRVTIIKDYALKHFKNNKVLDFAMAVEQVRSLFG